MPERGLAWPKAGLRSPHDHLTIELLASAFELTPREVVTDAVVAWTWSHTTHDLLAALQERHRWDASVPPVYLEHLRHIGLTPD